MSDFEQQVEAGVSRTWNDIVFDGEPAKTSIVNGLGTMRIDVFEILVKGLFDPDDIEGLITAQKNQTSDIDATFKALPDGWIHPVGSDDCPELIPISDEVLEEQIKEYEKPGEFIYLKTGKTI